MATIKSFTDLEQSKKLAEILPLESADMYYIAKPDSTNSNMIPSDICIPRKTYLDGQAYGEFCAWSLSALLSVLPFPVLYMEMLGGMIFWCCECTFMETDEVVKIEHYDNPIDACYDMIIKLHELKML